MEDVVIIGAGPAGLSAGIYASRYLMKHVIIGSLPGGLITTAHKVENYPGFNSLSGWELGQKFEEHARILGANLVADEATSIVKEPDGTFRIATPGSVYQSKAVLLAYGTKRRHLDVPGEGKFAGRGVSYCSVCDGAFFRDRVVGVIGGANAACDGALYLSDVAREVYLIYRKGALRAEPSMVDLLTHNPKIKTILNTNVTSLFGEEQLESVTLDKPYQGAVSLDLDGLFIEIGSEPDHHILTGLGVELDEENYIRIDARQHTSTPGVYAAGDITTGSAKFQQAITAASEGAIAAMSIFQDLKKNG
ncbi:hypothetical protein AUK40_02190 [Candidatus Wirthbacteria bacterium CG2_30_54_11]|uniref:FAD/NAD(P)-binding domain-containing protein n=1 Tax=Candidatus Wirthbacteria bacterium CG2_30_54_11 TaxID=1817892 RepID=A0A1J5IXR1_9BACT|nr:MAG: hypothetical protein AUK40_02190 [Candidatus Wirthbacteria bacterium CG2_30_54_11]